MVDGQIELLQEPRFGGVVVRRLGLFGGFAYLDAHLGQIVVERLQFARRQIHVLQHLVDLVGGESPQPPPAREHRLHHVTVHVALVRSLPTYSSSSPVAAALTW